MGWATLAWLALIFYLASLSGDELQATLPLHPQTSHWLGELRSAGEHLALFGVLAVLLHLNLRNWKGENAYRSRWLLAAAATASVYGIAMEYYQGYVPGRSASLLDMAVNCVGAAAALTTLRYWAGIKPVMLSPPYNLVKRISVNLLNFDYRK